MVDTALLAACEASSRTHVKDQLQSASEGCSQHIASGSYFAKCLMHVFKRVAAQHSMVQHSVAEQRDVDAWCSGQRSNIAIAEL